ncbi:MAG: hypothetical protein NC131_12045 [Roseburia sp.]|nr:hypothetical protein [Roseburia sp.]
MTNRIDSFEIKMDELNEKPIEDEIIRRCGIGGISTSNLGNIGAPTEREVKFFGVKGSVTCWISINKMFKKEGYMVSVSNIVVSKKKGKL